MQGAESRMRLSRDVGHAAPLKPCEPGVSGMPAMLELAGRIQPLVDGLASNWPCQSRAHAVEQNGSPFLTATSGRLLRQLTQRPSRRRGGSTLIEGCSSNLIRALSASFPKWLIAVSGGGLHQLWSAG
jgi:hypothetical protein